MKSESEAMAENVVVYTRKDFIKGIDLNLPVEEVRLQYFVRKPEDILLPSWFMDADGSLYDISATYIDICLHPIPLSVNFAKSH